MRSKTNFWQIIALIAVIGLLFAACGDSGSGSTTDPGTDDPSGGSSGGGGFYPGSKNPGPGTVDVSETYKLSETAGELPEGLEMVSAIQTGSTINVKLGGTVNSSFNTNTAIENHFIAQSGGAAVNFKPGRKFSWGAISGIWVEGEKVTRFKEINQSLNLYKGVDADPESPDYSYVHEFDTDGVYKLQENANPTARDADDTFGFLMWDGAPIEKATFEKTLDDGTMTTIIVDWSGVTFAGKEVSTTYKPTTTGNITGAPGLEVASAVDTSVAQDGSEVTLTIKGTTTADINDAAYSDEKGNYFPNTAVNTYIKEGEKFSWIALDGVYVEGRAVYKFEEFNPSFNMWIQGKVNENASIFLKNYGASDVNKLSYKTVGQKGQAYDATPRTFQMLLWDGAPTKKASLKITLFDAAGPEDAADPNGEDSASPIAGGAGKTITIIVDWTDVVINSPAIAP